jgi:hypothetical protein
MLSHEKTHTIEELGQRLRRMERSECRAEGVQASVGTGHSELDSLLPGGGLMRGTLVEWINAEGPGSGAVTLAILSASGLVGGWDGEDVSGCRGVLAVIERVGGFCPAAAAGLGVSPERMLMVRAETESEWKWAVEQVLRSRAVDVVLTWAGGLDDRVFRRWQLAAERGGGVGMLVRPREVVPDASWASLRLLVGGRSGEGGNDRNDLSVRGESVSSGCGRSWSVRVLRGGLGTGAGRAGDEEREVCLELDDETGGLHLLPRLVCPAPPGVSAVG